MLIDFEEGNFTWECEGPGKSDWTVQRMARPETDGKANVVERKVSLVVMRASNKAEESHI